MKAESNVRILKRRLHREGFTKHALHLNMVSKIKVVKMMSQNVVQLL
jgi:hypothetical protein